QLEYFYFVLFFFFFFQAEDGIRDFHVTGVQTCALPIYGAQDLAAPAVLAGDGLHLGGAQLDHGELGRHEEAIEQNQEEGEQDERSEERRVGKECRARWAPYKEKKKETISSVCSEVDRRK